MSQYTCGRCNSPVTRTTSQCPNCGILLNGIKCSKCSFVYSQSLFNCPSCGTNNQNAFKETARSGKTASMMFAVSLTLGAIVMWVLQFFPTRAMRFNTVFRVATNIFSMLAILLWIMVIVILKKSKNKEKARTNTNTTTPDQATSGTTAMDVLSAFDNLSRSIGVNVSYGEKMDAKLKEINADQVLPPDTQEKENKQRRGGML
jgi:RNA polymerase subunit RPABC4/transcription elongation factor Spt4